MKVELTGVPETLLWTLYQRAGEAARPDAVLADPRAVELVEAIDYPFSERFGPAEGPQAQWQALRTRRFDEEVRRFAARCPGGTVVALGEGLDTGFWRAGDLGDVRWLTVDLPETLAVRRALLPDDPPRRRSIACSATDADWIDAIEAPERGVLVTAQGLLMYLERAEVDGLVRMCGRRLPGATLVFDTAPRWFALLAQRGLLRTPSGWTAPAMPWGWDALERLRFRRAHPEIAELRELALPLGRGVTGLALPLLSHVPLAREVSLVVVRARLREGGRRSPRSAA